MSFTDKANRHEVLGAVHTLEGFLGRLKSIRGEILGGSPALIRHKEKHYVAMPESNTQRLEETLNIDVHRGGGKDEPVGGRIEFSVSRAAKALEEIDDHSKATIRFNGTSAIVFVTLETYEQLEYSRKRKAERDAKRTLSPGFANATDRFPIRNPSGRPHAPSASPKPDMK